MNIILEYHFLWYLFWSKS